MTAYRSTLLLSLACAATLAAMAPAPAHAEGDGWRFWRSAATVGSGQTATESRALNDFQAIGVSGSINVKVRQAARESVEVRADDNLLPLLETVIESSSSGRTLQVRWKRGQNVSTRTEANVTVDVVKLSAVASNGSGNVVVDALTTPSLGLSISGSGNAALNALQADDLSVRIAGSGDVKGDGKALRVKLSIAGSGDIALTGLRADDVTVNIAGSGDAAVNAQKTLTVSIAGSGDVVYVGDAAVKASVAGSGSVSKK